jgi:hypothetical protein
VHPFYPSLDTAKHPEQRQADERLQQLGAERLRDKYYFGYEKRVGSGG